MELQYYPIERRIPNTDFFIHRWRYFKLCLISKWMYILILRSSYIIIVIIATITKTDPFDFVSNS